MFTIQTLNSISSKGLDLFPKDKYSISDQADSADGILVRSFKMHDMDFNPQLKAIARAGAGVNNIPIDKCTEMGIIVFNTPGANANSVKELVLSGLFLSSRNLFDAMSWAKTLKGKGDEVAKLVEKGKSDFVGPEIKGKKLGVIGLGAIGSMVANDAIALGMEVVGFDPYISVEAAWGLSRAVQRAKSLETLLGESDYISLHIPLSNDTKGYLSKERFGQMKKNITILNFARGELVDDPELIKAIDQGIVKCYVTDFPNDVLLSQDKVVAIPHLGASTPEAEDNCAFMAVQQLKNFLEKGNILNSVNFPNCEMDMSGKSRLIIANRNIPNMISQITAVLAEGKINISDMLNRHRDEVAYNIIDTEGAVSDSVLEEIRKIDGIIMARIIK